MLCHGTDPQHQYANKFAPTHTLRTIRRATAYYKLSVTESLQAAKALALRAVPPQGTRMETTYLELLEVARLLRERALSVHELVSAQLARIERLDP